MCITLVLPLYKFSRKYLDSVDQYANLVYCSGTMTQKEYAKLVGCSHITLNAILRGRRRPSPQLARKIEEVMGVPKHTLRPDIFKPGDK